MMKFTCRILICALACMSSILCVAQEFTVVSFEESYNDISARTKSRSDKNDVKAALVKVYLPLTGATFKGNLGNVAVLDSIPSEYWVYLPADSKYLTIYADGVVPTKVVFANHSDDRIKQLVSETTYVLRLQAPDLGPKKFKKTTQFVELQVLPKKIKAMVQVDDGPVDEVDEDGLCSKLLTFGKHKYKITASGYYPIEKTIDVYDREKKQVESIQMVENFGYIHFNYSPEYGGGTIYVGEEEKGTLPVMDRIKLPKGNYTIKVKKKGYKEFVQNVEVPDRAACINVTVQMEAQFITMTITVDNMASIILDGEKIGDGTVNYNVPFGIHQIKASKEGYHDSEEKEIIVQKGIQTSMKLDAPIPKKGRLLITSEPKHAQIIIDNRYTGQQTPAAIDVLEGKHTVMLRKESYADITEQVIVHENQEEAVNMKFGVKLTKFKVRFRSNAKSANLYVDGTYKGKLPCEVELSNSSHKIDVRAAGYKDYSSTYTPNISNTSQFITMKEKVTASYTAFGGYMSNSGKIRMEYFSIGGNIGTSYGVEVGILNTRFHMFEICPLTWGINWSFLKENKLGPLPVKGETLYSGPQYGQYSYYTAKTPMNVYYIPQLKIHFPVKDNTSIYFGAGPQISWNRYSWDTNVKTTTTFSDIPTPNRRQTGSVPEKVIGESLPVWFTAEFGITWVGAITVPLYVRYQNGIVVGMSLSFGSILLD